MLFNIRKFCAIMAEREITLVELSKLTKIDVGNLSKYKNRQRNPHLKNIGKIAKALEVKIDDLMVEMNEAERTERAANGGGVRR